MAKAKGSRETPGSAFASRRFSYNVAIFVRNNSKLEYDSAMSRSFQINIIKKSSSNHTRIARMPETYPERQLPKPRRSVR